MARMTMRAARINAGFNHSGLSQKEAAAALGVSNKTLCAWESGKSYPKADIIPAICKLYDISFDDLIFLTDKPL